MIIDMHTHTFSPKVAMRAIPPMERAARMSAYTDSLPETLTATMREAGIDYSVVLPVATNITQPRKLNDIAVRTNEHTLETGLISFGAMHPDDPDWKRELSFLSEHNIKGIKLHPMYQKCDLDDVRTMRIIEEACALGMMVTVHMGEDVGVPGPARSTPENALRVQRMTGADKLILAHMGSWKLWDRVLDVLAGAPVYLDTAFSFGQISFNPLYPRTEEERVMGDTALLTEIIRKHGAERVLFGSDSPWGNQATELSILRALDLPQDDIADILGNNAARLLCLIPENV